MLQGLYAISRWGPRIALMIWHARLRILGRGCGKVVGYWGSDGYLERVVEAAKASGSLPQP